MGRKAKFYEFYCLWGDMFTIINVNRFNAVCKVICPCIFAQLEIEQGHNLISEINNGMITGIKQLIL